MMGKQDKDLLLNNDLQCDLADVVNKKHPKLGIKLQDTILKLIEFTAEAQLTHCKPIIEKRERERILREAIEENYASKGYVTVKFFLDFWQSLEGVPDED